jgi:Fe-S oxidoreductase
VVDLARANTEYRRYVDLMPQPASGVLKAVLYVEYFAETAEEIDASFESLRRVTPGISMQAHTNAADMLNAWKLRKAGEPLLHGIPGHRKPITFVEDNAIPVEHLSKFVKELRDIVSRHGTRAAYYAHASVGVLHVRPLIDLHEEADHRIMRRIAVEAADLARSLGGVMSGEHGDGRVRGPLLERYFGTELMGAFREIKRLFDPQNLLNPGNIVEPRPIESITSNLRVAPRGSFTPVPDGIDTYFDYADQHGFGSAVEMCNGAGVCRKKQGGTMCPSYQGTLDERHSTRGRGNALRLAITGQIGELGATAGHPTWNDPETFSTLDLCLSCKACKSECPSNVDIARLKSEYLAQSFKVAGTPFASRLMGNIRLLNRLGSMTPAISNWMMRFPPIRAVIERVMDVHPRRSLPPFSRPLNRAWTPTGTGTATVALFGDCFTMFNESGIGLAARQLLEACGYRVILADAGCCARAKISLGCLAEAIDEIDATCERLAPLIEDASVKAILFSEPSCLSAIKDDWKSLKVRASRSQRESLASKSFLTEDFIERHWESHPNRPTFDASRITGRVLLHGHCHQKALWGMQTSAALLRRAVGSKLVPLDTGCCGMAGAFGYASGRFDLSNRIGELALFPAARGMSSDDVLVAPGTSCRHQLHDAVEEAKTMHPVELLAELLQS